MPNALSFQKLPVFGFPENKKKDRDTDSLTVGILAFYAIILSLKKQKVNVGNHKKFSNLK